MLTPTFIEYLGTLFLISAVAFGGSPLIVIAALAIAVTFGGKISGAHFNPAVTLYQLIAGRISKSRAMYYVLAQLAAGLSVGLVHGMV
jgi:aquaporin Z